MTWKYQKVNLDTRTSQCHFTKPEIEKAMCVYNQNIPGAIMVICLILVLIKHWPVTSGQDSERNRFQVQR